MRVQYAIEYPAWDGDSQVGLFDTMEEARAEMHEFHAERSTYGPIYIYKQCWFKFFGWTVAFDKQIDKLG